MSDVEKLINLAIESYNPYQNRYFEYSSIATFTNENLNQKYQIVDVKGKDVLLPGSSGHHFLSAAYYGAKHITLYDISIFSKPIAFLYIGSMKALPDQKEFEAFTLNVEGNDDFFGRKTFNKVKESLPQNVAAFWEGYLSKAPKEYIVNLALPIRCRGNSKLQEEIKSLVPYHTEEGYKDTRQIIKDINYPPFIQGDIKKVNISNLKFDVIDLSNILESNVTIACDEYYNAPIDKIEKEWVDWAINSLSKSLNPDGSIILDYRQDISEPEKETSYIFNHDQVNKIVIDSGRSGLFPKNTVLIYKK